MWVLKNKTAENYLQLKGEYWDSLRKLGLPNYIKYNNEIVIILGKTYKAQKGKGRNTQCYYVLESGKEKHASFFIKLSKSEIRDLIIDKILND